MSVWFHIQTPHYIWLQNTKMVVVKMTISRIHKFSYSTPNSESAVNLTDVLGLRGRKTEQGTGKTCTIHIGRPQVTVFFFFFAETQLPHSLCTHVYACKARSRANKPTVLFMFACLAGNKIGKRIYFCRLC